MFIPLTAKTLAEYTPPSLQAAAEQEGGKPAPVFLIRVPTMMEREQISPRLLSLGLTAISESKMRATLIDELWTVYPDSGETAGKADQLADFLDGVWQRASVQETAIGLWQEQEAQRILDEAQGAPARLPYEAPPRQVSIRDEARAALISDEMIDKSQRLRDLAAEKMDYDRKNATLLIRINVAGVSGEGWDDLKIESVNDVLTEESAIAIRQRLDRNGWRELYLHIDRLYRLDEVEEKNSDLPLEKPSDQTGLLVPSGALGDSAGNLTTSSISVPLTDGSVMTIGPSSTSTSGHEERSTTSSLTAEG